MSAKIVELACYSDRDLKKWNAQRTCFLRLANFKF